MTIKRKSYVIFITVLCLLMALVGCSSAKDEATSKNSTTSSTKTDTEAAASGGEFTFALATAPDSLDPQASGMAVSTRVIKSIFETLLYQDTDNSLKPWLATEWEESEDKKTYTFKLREGVKFHDDSEFNADVVKYNFDRIFDPNTKAITAASYMKNVEAVEVMDNLTVKITLKSPSASFLTLLAHSNLSIVSQEAAEKAGDQFGLNPVGTGPFQFVESVENDRIVLERNENYHGNYPFADHEGLAYLDKLTFRIVPEEATRIGSVQSGQIKGAETVPPQDILAIEKSKQLKLWEAATGGLPYTLFINNTTAPWDDVKTRQALKAAIDVESIVNTLYLGTYDRAWSALAPTTLGYDASLENQESFDIEKANQLFDELGWKKDKDGFRKKDGQTLTLRILDDAVNREKRQDISLMVKEQLKAVGVDTVIEATNEARAKLEDSKAYDLRGNSRVAIDPTDLTLFYHSEYSFDKGGINIAWYANDELDILLEQAEVELDSAKRADIYKQVQQKIINDAVVIPVYVFPYTVATASDIQGLKFDSIGYPLFFDVNITK